MSTIPGDEATRVLFYYLENIAPVYLHLTDDWEQSLRVDTDFLFVIQPGPSTPNSDYSNTREFRILTFANDSVLSSDIAIDTSRALNQVSVINDAGWILYCDVARWPERLEPINDQVEGFGFVLLARTRQS